MTNREKYEMIMSQLDKSNGVVCYKFYELAMNSDMSNRGKLERALYIEKSTCTIFFYQYTYYPRYDESLKDVETKPLIYAKFALDDMNGILNYLDDVIMIKAWPGKVLWAESLVTDPKGEKCFIIGNYLYRESALKKIIDTYEKIKNLTL